MQRNLSDPAALQCEKPPPTGRSVGAYPRAPDRLASLRDVLARNLRITSARNTRSVPARILRTQRLCTKPKLLRLMRPRF